MINFVLRPLSHWCPLYLFDRRLKLLVTHFSPVPRYIVPLRPKHPPQHPILEHSRSVLFLYCQRPSLKPIQNNRQKSAHSSLYLIVYGFLMIKARTKIVDRMAGYAVFCPTN